MPQSSLSYGIHSLKYVFHTVKTELAKYLLTRQNRPFCVLNAFAYGSSKKVQFFMI